MIESIMYAGIGFLFATLLVVAVSPLIHTRAVRLTIRRLENSIPQSMTEIEADKDALRADFAMSTRRLEMCVEQLKSKDANQLAELGQKGDAINRLKMERQAQKVEVVALKTEVEALKGQLSSADKKVEVMEGPHRESAVISLLPRARPTAEPVMPMDFQQVPPLNYHPREGDFVSLTPNERPEAEEAQSGGPARDPNAGRDSSNHRSGMVREGSDLSAGLQFVEPSTHPSPRIVSSRPPIGRRIFRGAALFFIAGLIGVGATFAWQSQGDQAKEMVRSWVASLPWWASAPTTKLPPDTAADQPGSLPASQAPAQDAAHPQTTPVTQEPTPAATATSPELAKPLEDTMKRDLVGEQHSVEQLAGKQEQAQPQDEPNKQERAQDEQKMLLPASQTPEKFTPAPETRPTAVADWTLREVIDGAAVLQGPNGIRRVTRGDTVPGLGRVNSIVRWGNRWTVATTNGYCKSVLPNQPAEECTPYRGN
jgi:hypothetical protein